jgi:ankyrin repeat protein
MRKLNCLIILMIALFFVSENLYGQNYTFDDLIEAISNEDLNSIAKLHDSDPGKFRALASVSLLVAAEVGSTRIAQYLINNGADVSYTNSDNETPLNIAAEWADYAMIELLCQNGANDNPDGRLWGKSKTTLTAMKLVFKKRNMSAATKERNGVKRTVRFDDIERALAIIHKYSH